MTTGDPQNIAEILATLKATTPLGAHLDHAQIWEHWPDIAGLEFAPQSHPMKVRKGVLTVAVANTVWMHKLSYEKQTMIEKINRLLSKDPIEDIYLTLPTNEDLAPPDPPQK